MQPRAWIQVGIGVGVGIVLFAMSFIVPREWHLFVGFWGIALGLLIVVVTLAFHVIEIRVQKSRAHSEKHYQSVPDVIRQTAEAEVADRIFIKKSALEMVAPFTSGFTDYQVKKLTSDYLGKWVSWTVRITNVEQYGDTPHISTYVRDEPRLPLYVSMWFPLSEKAKVLLLEKDEKINIEGQIEAIETREVRLRNCRLVDR